MSHPIPLPINPETLLRGKPVEWERLEFKQGWNPQAVLHTLCAFANDLHNLGGGYLVLGVAEQDGQPVLPPAGLAPESLDAIQKELLNLGQHAIRPPYHPIAVPHVIEGRHLLILWAPGGQTRPYRARVSLGKDDREYAWYVRKGSSTVVARGADEAELLSLAATVPFDDRVNQQARIEDLSRDLLREFLAEVDSALASPAATLPLTDLARQMALVGGAAEAPIPLNVGLLFFHAQPQRYFPGTQIDVVWFPEGPGGDRFTEKVFRGPLHHMVREALAYIERNYLSETVIKHPRRAESRRVANFPFAAIEEALVNAVYHRSYEQREPVEVRISRTELTVVSYPGPDRSVKLEQLRAGRALSRRYRNRRIGELLKELGLTEGRGTGIGKIQRAMRDNGSPAPVFEFDEDHSYFAVILPVHPHAEPPVTDTARRDLPQQVTPQVTPQVTWQVARLLGALEGERSARELQTALGLEDRENFRAHWLIPALDAGFIEMTIPDKPRSSRQRYRRTERGRALVSAQPRSTS